MSANHRVTDWLNEEQRTPPPPPCRRSVSDMREISRIMATTLPVWDMNENYISAKSALLNKNYQEIKIENLKTERSMPIVKFEDKAKKDEDTKPSPEKPTENRPNTLLRRSVSDLRQKSISARNF